MNHLGEVMLKDKNSWIFHLDVFKDLFSVLKKDVIVKWVSQNDVEAARKLARHLPTPFIDSNGAPQVPELTYFVMQKYGDDEKVFSEFCSGVHSMQTYWGDIAAAHEKEAQIASKFLDHELEAIRKWAERERKSASHMAEEWKRKDEEDLLR
jgi:hypothetical protein